MQPNPRKTKGVRALGRVDAAALTKAVLAIPEEIWERENVSKPNRFDALDRTHHIVFRFVKDGYDWTTYYDLPMWSEFAPLLEPVLRQAIAAYGYERGEFPRIMLARMAPGGVILPHTDSSVAARWPHKIHVPLQTNDRVTFFVDPSVYHLAEGQAYELNNMGTHAVRNDGTTNRIHLIFEYFDPGQPVT
jgi:hypothetical protein